jgi:CheY-like chemotaxis protein
LERIRILYAEDYDLILFTARQLLEAEGWEVEVCRDGAATLKKLEGGEHFDLLIFDDRLDGVGCEELTARAREHARLSATPIILFTAGHTNGDPAACEADARLSKPGGLKDLVPTCRRLLTHAAPQSGLDARSGESSGASG